MSNTGSCSTSEVCIAPVFRYSETDELVERAATALHGLDYNEELYRGLRPEVIRKLLDSVGEAGDRPDMASLLFRVGIESTEATQREKNNRESLPSVGQPLLYGVYVGTDRPQPDDAPDALLHVQGFGLNTDPEHEVVIGDYWSNPDSSKSTHSHTRAMAFWAVIDALSSISGKDIVVSEATSESQVEPTEYECEPPIDRLSQLGDVTDYGERHELLGAFRDLYAATGWGVTETGYEGEDIYETALTEPLLDAVNLRQKRTGDDALTALIVDREDRTNIGEYRYYGQDSYPYYTNGWGDMTLRLQLESGGVVTCYTLRVYMDAGHREAYLDKYTTEVQHAQSRIAKEACHMLASIQDPLAEETGFNTIDEKEYQRLLQLVRTTQTVASK